MYILRNMVNIRLYISVTTRVFQKTLSLAQEELEKNDTFSLFFMIVSLDNNSLGPTIHKLCIPITNQVSQLVLQKFFQCTYLTKCLQNGEHAGGT